MRRLSATVFDRFIRSLAIIAFLIGSVPTARAHPVTASTPVPTSSVMAQHTRVPPLPILQRAKSAVPQPVELQAAPKHELQAYLPIKSHAWVDHAPVPTKPPGVMPVIGNVAESADQARATALLASGVTTNSLAIQITPGIPEDDVPNQGFVFFQATQSINYRGGKVLIASSPDGGGGVLVDDQITIRVTHPDGSQSLYIRNFGQGCPVHPVDPELLDVTPYLAFGSNTVEVELKDTCGHFFSSTALWLVPASPQEQNWSPNECPFCGNQERQGYVGGPINTFSGNYNYEVADLSIPTAGQPLQFIRSYNSNVAAGPFYANSIYNRPLGVGWTHNHDIRLLLTTSVITDQLKYPIGTIALKAPHGSLLTFYPDGGTHYVAAPGIQATLNRSPNTPYVYTATTANQTSFVFDSTGKLTSQRDPTGQVLSYTYYMSGSLQRVTDLTTQRYLEFFYRPNPAYGGMVNLQRVQDSLGRQVDFQVTDCTSVFCRLSGITDTRSLTWTYQYGTGSLAQFRLAAILDPDGRIVERNEYDVAGKVVKQWNGANELIAQISVAPAASTLITLTDALSRTTVHNYSSGVWVGGVNAATQAITRAYDTNFRVSQVADPGGSGPHMVWSPNGHTLDYVVDANSYTTTMKYDGFNNLTQTVDARGFTTTYTYSGTFLTRKVDAVGSTWLYTPTADGRNLLAAELAPGGRLTEYQYDQFGQRSVVTDALKGVTRYGYDPVGRLITITDSLGRITVNAYDKADQLIAVTANFTTTGGVDPNAFNLTTRYGYDGFGRQIAVTDTLQHVTRNYYDRAGRLISVTVNFTTTSGVDPTAYNLTTRYGYDAVGNQIAITDTLERVTRYEYDALDRMIATTDPMTGTTRYGYDAAGHQTVITDPSGIATYFTYDALGRLTDTRNLLGQTTHYAYDGMGNRTAITDANGLVTRYAYDGLSRLISVTENYSTTGLSDYQTNVTTRYGYDAIGNRTVITNARSQTTTYTYDALSRLVAETNPLSQITRHQYDAVGNRVVMTDAKNQVTRYGYDGLNRLVVITYTADATTVKYAYDALGNRTALTDTTGTTTYRYDALSRPLTVTSPLTGAVGYRYNAVGNRTHLIYPDGKEVTYTYDAANRLTGVSPWSSSPVSYTYDAAGRPREVKVGGALTTRYGYDAVGRMTWLHHLTATGSAAFYSYQLDAVGNRIQVIESRDWPWKAFLPLILNGSTGGGAMMMSAPMMPSAPVGSSSSTFASPLAAPQSFTSPLATPTAPGSSTSNTVPDLSMLLLTPVIVAAVVAQKKDRRWSLPIAVLAGILVTIGAAQSSSGAAPRPMPFLSPQSPPPQSGCTYPAAVPGGRVISYAYDPLYRLSAAAYSTGECYQYAYDKVGNRTTQTATITSTLVTTYAYDVADRLTSVNGQTYTWDNNGSLTNNGKFTFAYNNAGRMTQAQGITATQVYTYNGDGLLMNRNGARYVWDQAADLPQMLSDGTTLYVPGVGQWNGTSWAYELPDGLGSVRQLADAQGNIVQRYDYSPFGEVVAAQGTRSSKLQYTGEQNDLDTGLIYLRARWYDPATGRFTSRDPFRGIAGLPQTLHPYVYVHNNPINLTDPSGELGTPDMLWDAAMVLIDAGFLIWDALNPCLDQATRQQLMGQDLLFLGADATAFFIPLLPGGGGVTLLGRGAAALAETVVRVPEVIRIGLAVQKGVQIGTHLAQSSNASQGSRKFKQPKPGASGKEGATNIPSWAKGERPYEGESGKDFAKRLCDKRFGPGNYGTGPTSDFNQLKKYGDRHFQ